MQLVGYSNSAQKTLESNAILCVKIFGENIGQENAQRRGFTLAFFCFERSRDLSKNFGCTSTPQSIEHINNGRNTINNKNTTGAMHTHDDMQF